jgi:N-acetylglucosamine kinase-like BadF-type ATPase
VGSVSGPVILAVDGGNSKTDVALVTEDGELLGRAFGPGSNPQRLGVAAVLKIIGDLAEQAAGGPPPPLRHAAVYLAGLDLPAEEEQMATALTGTGWTSSLQSGNDTFALLRAGARSADAVAVICGAGMNCVGARADGRTVRFPSLGYVSGDWGGGVQLGREALWHAVRAEDGRGRPTTLAGAIAAYFGQKQVADVSAAFHFGQIADTRVGELTAVLFDCATHGDPVALDLVARMAEEISTLALVALRRLDRAAAPAEVVLGGGVIRARHPLLEDAVLARIHAGAPRALIRVVTDPPVLGAALLGLDRLAGGRAPTAAEQRLRARLGSADSRSIGASPGRR